jgi:thiol-disulfide isomerase/thioredoxin
VAHVDWIDNDIDAAFAQARARELPLLLYWGAVWCPPCNRIKAAVLGQEALAERALVALHIDGDADGAQRLAERLGVRSYPTFVLYQPDGAEITRLPCELDGPAFLAALDVALRVDVTAAQALATALAQPAAVTDDAWRLLANYAWDTDEDRLLAGRDLAATLGALTAACTQDDAAARLCWHALHAAGEAASVDGVLALLADQAASRAQMDLVSQYAVDLVRSLSEPHTAARGALTQAFADALERIENDATVAAIDQLQALRTRVRMARMGAPVAGLGALASARVAELLAAPGVLADPALHHALLNTAAGMLTDAGLALDAERVLLSALDVSHAPYYFMHSLAAAAKKRGDTAAMFDWYERAWRESHGSATRLQWGVTAVLALLDGADPARIERLSAQMLAELAAVGDAACQRNRTQLARLLKKLDPQAALAVFAAAALA